MINTVVLIGNVGNDPEIRNLDSGSKVAKFSLATSETYKTKSGEKTTETQWHRIVVFGAYAEVVEKYVQKGMQLYISGKIKYGSYENKDGVKVYTTDISADTIRMVGKKQESPAAQEIKRSESEPKDVNNGKVADGVDDLPF